ncbi:SDR family oxidoreductase [Rhizobium sp. S95]|uniref:SDR family oxidoreductase n=1 Tax=Ciceribacter sichuanensis TaxID=2949647 RepID=A0AAJ1FK28_9HYPH|nr:MULTISPECIES: SDR family oxidoreductase [unclassified Ciceribacter]MCM2395738.1 SDR family oxidoreductase [Ciceribacter sp. S95]MCO5958911.1 SDR family oxidoreductase [Ciceribacter sp. S101]
MTDTNRIALVTGANKGIGLEIARQLAKAGVTVLMGARDLQRGQAAAGELAQAGLAVEAIEVDLNNEATITAAAAAISSRHGRLDILVNNAGIVDAEDGPPTVATVAAARRLMETNFLGTLAVTQAMLPLLRRSKAGRIVNLSTTLGSLAVNGDPTSPYYEARLMGYNASKAALNMLTVQLAAELKNTPIVVNSVAPGYVKTDLTGGNGFMTPEEGARLPVEYALLGADAVSGRFVAPDGPVAW